MHTRVGLEHHMAPEMICGNYDDTNDEEALPFTLAVDMWSLGYVLFRLLTRQLPFISPSSLVRYYGSRLPFPITALNQNDISKDGIAIISEMMKPGPADRRINVSAALHHSWTCAQTPTLKGPVPAVHDYFSGFIEEISIAELQLSAHASYVSNDDNERSHLKLGTAAMPQTPQYCNINNSENEDAAARSAGAETAGNEFDRHQKKLDLREQVIKMPKRVLGAEHIDTLLSMDNLARSDYSQGQYEQAAQLTEQTVEVRKRVLGAEHESALRSMHNLALSYRNQGQYEQAAQLGEQTVQVRKRVLGAEHTDTLQSMHKLALFYHRQGQYEQTAQLGGQTIEMRKRVLGAEHVDTLRLCTTLPAATSRIACNHKQRSW